MVFQVSGYRRHCGDVCCHLLTIKQQKASHDSVCECVLGHAKAKSYLHVVVVHVRQKVNIG